jgi:hypothetical protein
MDRLFIVPVVLILSLAVVSALDSNGLVAYWDMEGSGGTIADLSDQGNDLQSPSVTYMTVDAFDSGEAWLENQMYGSASGGNYVGNIINKQDPYMYKNIVDFDESYDNLELRYKSYTGGPASIAMYYIDGTDCTGFSATCVQGWSVVSDDNWHTLSVKITDPEWVDNDGIINYLRFDFDSASTLGKVYIDYIKFFKDQTPTEASGKIGKAREFDGLNDYFYAPDDDSFTVDEFSLEAWVYPEKTGVNQMIMGNGGGWSDEGYHLIYLSNGKVRFEINDSSAKSVLDSTVALPLNSWHHVVGVYDGDKQSIYIDGDLDVEKTVSLQEIDSKYGLGIGFGLYSSYQGAFLKGRIDEPRVWNRALSEDDVSDLYALTEELDTSTSTTTTTSTTTITSTMTTVPAVMPSSLEMDGLACNSTACNLTVTSNTVNDDSYLYIFIKSDDGLLYYVGTLDIDKDDEGDFTADMYEVVECGRGADLTLLALAYDQDNLNQPVGRFREDIECNW